MPTPVEKLIADADLILSGNHANALLDWRDAAQMYETAGNFGSGKALSKLAYMYLGSAEKKYFKEDRNKALALYKKSASLGYMECLPQLANLYNSMWEPENFMKIWIMIFDNAEKFKPNIKDLIWYVFMSGGSKFENLVDMRLIDYYEEIADYYIDSTKTCVGAINYIDEKLDNGETFPGTSLNDTLEMQAVWLKSLETTKRDFSRAQAVFEKLKERLGAELVDLNLKRAEVMKNLEISRQGIELYESDSERID